MVDLPPKYDPRTLHEARVIIGDLLAQLADLNERVGETGSAPSEAEPSKTNGSKRQVAHSAEISRRHVAAFSQDQQKRIKRGDTVISLAQYAEKKGERADDKPKD